MQVAEEDIDTQDLPVLRRLVFLALRTQCFVYLACVSLSRSALKLKRVEKPETVDIDAATCT